MSSKPSPFPVDPVEDVNLYTIEEREPLWNRTAEKIIQDLAEFLEVSIHQIECDQFRKDRTTGGGILHENLPVEAILELFPGFVEPALLHREETPETLSYTLYAMDPDETPKMNSFERRKCVAWYRVFVESGFHRDSVMQFTLGKHST